MKPRKGKDEKRASRARADAAKEARPFEFMEGVELRAARLVGASEASLRESRSLSAEFCLADIDVAFTFLDRAEVTSNPGARAHAIATARQAYEVIAALLPRLRLEPETHAKVWSRLGLLAERLAQYPTEAAFRTSGRTPRATGPKG